MEPTLLVGDWLFVNKLRFGPHIPFTSYSLPGYAKPKRGDVTVFVSPPQDVTIRISPDEITPTLVKRIVGVAGDTLVMRHGQLTVNGVVVPSPNTFVLPDSFADQPQNMFAWQHQIEIRGSRFGSPVTAPSLHEWGPLVVPPGTFFMMGDNRDNSVDSRYYGPVPRANLRGTPMFVYYSYDPERGTDYRSCADSHQVASSGRLDPLNARVKSGLCHMTLDPLPPRQRVVSTRGFALSTASVQ